MFTVYSADWCTYCTKVKQVLTRGGFEFKEVDIDQDNDKLEWLKKQGLRSLPQVFTLDGKHIGGCDDTIAYIHAMKG